MPRYRCPYVSEMRDRFRVPRATLVDSVGVDRIGASAEEKESLTGAAEQLSSPDHDEATLEKKKVEMGAVEMNEIDGGKEEDVEKAEKVMKVKFEDGPQDFSQGFMIILPPFGNVNRNLLYILKRNIATSFSESNWRVIHGILYKMLHKGIFSDRSFQLARLATIHSSALLRRNLPISRRTFKNTISNSFPEQDAFI